MYGESDSVLGGSYWNGFSGEEVDYRARASVAFATRDGIDTEKRKQNVVPSATH